MKPMLIIIITIAVVILAILFWYTRKTYKPLHTDKKQQQDNPYLMKTGGRKRDLSSGTGGDVIVKCGTAAEDDGKPYEILLKMDYTDINGRKIPQITGWEIKNKETKDRIK